MKKNSNLKNRGIRRQFKNGGRRLRNLLCLPPSSNSEPDVSRRRHDRTEPPHFSWIYQQKGWGEARGAAPRQSRRGYNIPAVPASLAPLSRYWRSSARASPLPAASSAHLGSAGRAEVATTNRRSSRLWYLYRTTRGVWKFGRP